MTGLEARYHVEKLKDSTGKHDNCEYFVLDPKHDPIARLALAEYADHAYERGYEELARDLGALLERTK